MSLMTNGPQSSVKTYEVSLFAPSQSELFDRKLKINLSFIALSVCICTNKRILSLAACIGELRAFSEKKIFTDFKLGIFYT